MTSEELFGKFKEVFPVVYGHSTSYVPYGTDCILVTTDNGNKFKFLMSDDEIKLTRIK